MPLASPASGSPGWPRTSGARPPPTGPPIVPETNTHDPAFTALGIRSGVVVVEPGSQMLFLAIVFLLAVRGLAGRRRAACDISARALGLEVARERAGGDEAE